jgi:5-enolpyruvylshikimate-3-phosphate synthase
VSVTRLAALANHLNSRGFAVTNEGDSLVVTEPETGLSVALNCSARVIGRRREWFFTTHT